jgi:hypothetical protein
MTEPGVRERSVRSPGSCGGKKAQLHVPYFVKHEFITQREEEIRKQIKAIRRAIHEISESTAHEELEAFVKNTQKETTTIKENLLDYPTEEFSTWLDNCHAIVHPIASEHGERVAEDYFKGTPPFKNVKNRADIPDSFVWHMVVDLVQKHKPLHVVANDNALYSAAKATENMIAYKTLEEFSNSPQCQDALKELTNEILAKNLERVQALLPKREKDLIEMVESDIVNALNGQTINDSSIPDDNNEGLILMIGSPEDVTFDFEGLEYYGETEFGIPFTTVVDCELNYAIFKSDYFVLDEERTKNMSISERNEHYFDVDEEYPIAVEGVLSIAIDGKPLENEDIDDDEIVDLLTDSSHDVEINEMSVAGSEG